MKVGDKIRIGSEIEKMEKKCVVMVEYTIIEVYSKCVLGVTERGIKRAFSLGDLVETGYLRQDDKYEAFRKEVDIYSPGTGRLKPGKKKEVVKCL